MLHEEKRKKNGSFQKERKMKAFRSDGREEGFCSFK